jgi:hypothetical protein
MKAATKAKLSARLKDYYARMKREQPEQWANLCQRSRDLWMQRKAREKALAQESFDAPFELDVPGGKESVNTPSSPEKEPEEPGSPARSVVGKISALPFNPRMARARLPDGNEVEVVVGNNSKLWLECPVEVKVSSDYPGYYEVVGDLPRGRWDRVYAERFNA